MAGESNYKEELQKLIQLQEFDAEIYDLWSKKETFPVKIREMTESLEEKKSGMNAAEEESKSLQVAQNEKENEMAANEEKIRKHEADLFQIKTNKEYKALQQEIESIKADVSIQEEEIINLLDKIEEAKKKLEEEKKIFEEETKKVTAEQERIKSEEKEIDRRLGELENKRKGSAQNVDPDILGKYEKILETRGGIALSKVNGEFCGQCHMTLRPQIINEAKLKSGPVFCESCSRILYEED